MRFRPSWILAVSLLGACSASPPPPPNEEPPSPSPPASVAALPVPEASASSAVAAASAPSAGLPDPSASASASAPSPRPSPLAVSLAANGTWAVNGKPLAAHDDLLVVVRAIVARDPTVHAVLEADREVRAGEVVHAIELLKEGGVSNVAFAVAPPTPNGARPKP